MQPRSDGWFTWFWAAPAAARRGPFAAWLGWALDGFDVMLYALVLGTLIADLSLTKPVAGLLGSLTPIASGFGGVIWALVALAPVTTFFATGFFAGFGAVTAERYPTAIRATATEFTAGDSTDVRQSERWRSASSPGRVFAHTRDRVAR
jgi:hypothetical protein